MRFIIFLVIGIFFNAGLSFAQHNKVEYSGLFDSYYARGPVNINVTSGITAYTGDLCPLLKCMDFQTGFGIGASYKLWPRVMFGADFLYFKLKGHDTENPERGLAFTSTNMEFDLYGRFYLVDDIVRTSRDRLRKPTTVKSYLVGGIGYLMYNPTTYYTETPSDSVFLISENKFRRSTLVVPAGVGVSYWFSYRFTLGLEFTYRFAFTDYLDGVSQRGNPERNDGFAMISLKAQISPTAPVKFKKKKTLAPPEKYEGEKGTDTWKNRPKQAPAQKRKYYYDDDEDDQQQQQPQEEDQPQEQPEEDDGW